MKSNREILGDSGPPTTGQNPPEEVIGIEQCASLPEIPLQLLKDVGLISREQSIDSVSLPYDDLTDYSIFSGALDSLPKSKPSCNSSDVVCRNSLNNSGMLQCANNLTMFSPVHDTSVVVDMQSNISQVVQPGQDLDPTSSLHVSHELPTSNSECTGYSDNAITSPGAVTSTKTVNNELNKESHVQSYLDLLMADEIPPNLDDLLEKLNEEISRTHPQPRKRPSLDDGCSTVPSSPGSSASSAKRRKREFTTEELRMKSEEQRYRNNEASRRSRASRKLKFVKLEEEMEFLASDNQRMRVTVDDLESVIRRTKHDLVAKLSSR